MQISYTLLFLYNKCKLKQTNYAYCANKLTLWPLLLTQLNKIYIDCGYMFKYIQPRHRAQCNEPIPASS